MKFSFLFIVATCLLLCQSLHFSNATRYTFVPGITKALISYCNVSSFFCSYDPSIDNSLWNCTVKFNRLSEVGKHCMKSQFLHRGFNFVIEHFKIEQQVNLIWYKHKTLNGELFEDRYLLTTTPFDHWLTEDVEIDDCGVEGGDGESCKDRSGMINGNTTLSPEDEYRCPYDYCVPKEVAILCLFIVLLVSAGFYILIAVLLIIAIYYLFVALKNRIIFAIRACRNKKLLKTTQLYDAIIDNDIDQAWELSHYFDLVHVELAIFLERYSLLNQCFPSFGPKSKVPPEVKKYFDSPEHQSISSEYQSFILNNWGHLQEIGFVFPLT